MTRYQLLDEKLINEISAKDKKEQAQYLFLDSSPDFRGRWAVDALHPEWYFDFEDIVGSFRTVSPAGLERFLILAEELDYRVIFNEPPEKILQDFQGLSEPPPFSLLSNYENTVQGFFPWQIESFNKLIRDESLSSGLVVHSTGMGKAQPLDANVLTPRGWRAMGELKVGDKISGLDGKSQTVNGIYPQGQLKSFKVIFNDGTSVVCSEDHLWAVEKWTSHEWKGPHQREIFVKTTRELMNHLFTKTSGIKASKTEKHPIWSLPSVAPIEFDIKNKLPINPYLLGLLIGDGNIIEGTPKISTSDKEVVESVEGLLPTNFKVKKVAKYDYSLAMTGSSASKPNTLTVSLKELGLWGHKSYTKFIPDCYKYASVKDRVAIIQGINDSDGSPSGCGSEFSSASLRLIEDYAEVVRSLGGFCPTPKERQTYWTNNGVKQRGAISYRTKSVMPFSPFRLKRKLELMRPYKPRLRSIMAIEKLDEGVEMQCIKVSNPDEIYITDYTIPTHNTVFVISSILWHSDKGHNFDFGLVVVKANNKADMNRKLSRLGGIESIIIDGTPAKRTKIYENIETKLKTEKVIAITNYEKFREDPDQLKKLIKNRDVLIFWDEIPTRLSNRSTKLYGAVKNVLWKRFQSKENGLADAESNAKWIRQWGLTATPIENNPEGLFNYLRLMNPPLLGKVEEFYDEYVATRNYFSKKPELWMNLDRLEAKIEHMTHRASREHDPEIAKLFPAVFEDTLVIDWHPKDRKIYNILTGKAKELVEADFSEANVLAMIQVLQMVCDAPSMINTSAKNRINFEKMLDSEEDLKFEGPHGSSIAADLAEALNEELTDDTHTKLDTLREILLEKHPEDKAIIFMTWASYGFAPITKKLDEWGITYVTYEGTQKHANEAKDEFRQDDGIRVFLSSDRGADSIDLPEAAVGINYNLPWTWVRKRQRMRNVRVDSTLETNYWYDLIMANSVEERKKDIINQKYKYHAQIFDGNVVDESISARISQEDLFYILTGES